MSELQFKLFRTQFVMISNLLEYLDFVHLRIAYQSAEAGRPDAGYCNGICCDAAVLCALCFVLLLLVKELVTSPTLSRSGRKKVISNDG